MYFKPVARGGVDPVRKAPGGEEGCLGCAGMLVLPLLFVAIALLFPGHRNRRHDGFPEALEDLAPGMSLAEARTVFPGNSSFETEAADEFEENAWVTHQDAEAAMVLHVEPEEARPSREGDVPEPGGGVDVYFDENGQLVGVRERVSKAGNWRAVWGVLHNPREEEAVDTVRSDE